MSQTMTTRKQFVKANELKRDHRYEIKTAEKTLAYMSNSQYQINVLLDNGCWFTLRRSREALQSNPQLLEIMLTDLARKKHYIVVEKEAGDNDAMAKIVSDDGRL